MLFKMYLDQIRRENFLCFSQHLYIILIVNLLFTSVKTADDYYSLLGITKDADSREIRKAFKKLALELHPDKNKNDAEIHEKFLKINQVYETLKDEESRRKYDLYGADGTNQSKPKSRYQSYDYYKQSFGIYDDDSEIITLSKSDFERSVLNTNYVWFVNFYSPMCSHCHHLAPAWRQVARELSGVVHIGAVNCEEEWILCRNQGIGSYPSIVLYPDRSKYGGDRSASAMIDYIFEIIPSKLIRLRNDDDLETYLQSLRHERLCWLFFFCDHSSECPSDRMQLKVAAMLGRTGIKGLGARVLVRNSWHHPCDSVKDSLTPFDGLVNVARVDRTDPPQRIADLYDGTGSVLFFDNGKLSKEFAKTIPSFDAQEITNLVLEKLPDIETIDRKSLLKSLSLNWRPLAILFINGQSNADLELRKLPILIPEVDVRKVACEREHLLCNDYHVHKYPTIAVFKSEHQNEFYHDRLTALDVASFVRDSITSSVESLDVRQFQSRVVDDGEPYFIDFYAPWCPPCLQLLPEWRKASRSFTDQLRFATVDCTIHHSLCNKYNVRSYPTTILFNRSNSIHYGGQRTSDEIVEFVRDVLSPSVITLTGATVKDLSDESAGSSDIWAIDFYAPWCGPCQQLSPQWRNVAKSFSDVPNVHVAQVDCTDETELCNDQKISSYPTLRIYPNGIGSNTYFSYDGWNRDLTSLRAWIFQFLPGSVSELDNNDFYNRVVYGTDLWIVDFYAPWCGHCHTYAPEFEIIARSLSPKVKAGKVNCEKTRFVCQQAGIRAYPTVKFYPGSRDGATPQDVVGLTLDSQETEHVVMYVESWIKRQTKHTEEHDEL